MKKVILIIPYITTILLLFVVAFLLFNPIELRPAPTFSTHAIRDLINQPDNTVRPMGERYFKTPSVSISIEPYLIQYYCINTLKSTDPIWGTSFDQNQKEFQYQKNYSCSLNGKQTYISLAVLCGFMFEKNFAAVVSKDGKNCELNFDEFNLIPITDNQKIEEFIQ